MSYNLAIILGTRPEIIKMSPIIRKAPELGVNLDIIHTNQHYSENMDAVFFDELDLPHAKYNLNIGSGSHGNMTGRMLIGIEEILQKNDYSVVLVQGDTNTVLAGAVAASKLGIRVGHVEAGLRCYDKTMPEEINRTITDHVSDYLFVPTQRQFDILKNEGISEEKIFVTGNTIVDAVYESVLLANKKSEILHLTAMDPNRFILFTCHRSSNTDTHTSLRNIIDILEALVITYRFPILFPLHPRTKKMLEFFNLTLPQSVTILEPLGYLDLLSLQMNAFLIVTDSGGIQEEACILQKKCLVLRTNTERPETLEVGGTILMGESSINELMQRVDILLKEDIQWYCPFGDGTSGQKIIAHLLK